MGVLYSLFLTSLHDYRDYKSLNYYPQKIAFQQKQLSLQHQPKGKALLPVQGSGKVKVGQRVNVRLTNFPDQEFGYLIGRVESISNIPTPEGFYVLEIVFLNIAHQMCHLYHSQMVLRQIWCKIKVLKSLNK